MHPAPGSETPSYASVVGSVDSSAARYVSRMAVQQSRQEIIADLEGMVTVTDFLFRICPSTYFVGVSGYIDRLYGLPEERREEVACQLQTKTDFVLPGWCL